MAQHDYVISNGTGSAVRSDLNNALSAIVSQNSGATAPATTYAFQFWADTTTNTLKLRNSANSAWIELRQLDGDFTTVSVDNGTAAAPSIYFNASGTDTGIYSSGTDAVDISTAGTRRFGISSSGELTAYGGNLTLNGQGDLRFADSDSSNWVAFQSPATVSSNVTWTLPSADGTNGQALTTNGSGTLSWTSPAATTDKITEGNTEAEVVDTGSDGHFKVTTEGTERFRCDSSGRLLLGTSSARTNFYNAGVSSPNQIEGTTDQTSSVAIIQNYNAATYGAQLILAKSNALSIGSNTLVASGDACGRVTFQGNDGTDFVEAARIEGVIDGTPGANDMPGRIVLSTTADGASSPTERMRIDSSGRILIGTTSADANTKLHVSASENTSDPMATDASITIANTVNAGNNEAAAIKFNLGSGNAASISAHYDSFSAGVNSSIRFYTQYQSAFNSPAERMRITPMGALQITFSDGGNEAQIIDRTTADGTLIKFKQAGTTEGEISVSGTTVTYGGGHLARWSQLPNDEDPSTLFKGTVMSNLDEMCEWGEEANEQLNKTKVSDVEGDPNVAGVFVSISPSEDGPLDFFVGMTGDMIIRIAAGVTVERGDLLMSAGDGTAKPQDDDIIRSKTIAKVTSTNVSCTYDDGSYCVPCVLMAC